MICPLRHRRVIATAIALLCATAVGDGLARSTRADQCETDQADGHEAKAVVGADNQRRETICLHVRVVDTAGRPVPTATVRVIVLTDEQKFETQTLSFDGKTELAVGADGKLLTPPLEFDKAYVLHVEAPRMLSSLSRWSRSAEKGTVKLPDVVLRRLLLVAGSVVTRENQPVAGATVIQSGDGPIRTEATTDQRGRFEIAGVPEQGAFLFVEKEGYAFHGQPVAAEDGPVQFVLERADDPRRRRLATLPLPTFGLSRAERLDLAFQVLKPRLSHRLAQKPVQADFWLMRELAHADFPAAFDYFDALVAAGVSQVDRDRQIDEIASVIVVSDPVEAMALAQRVPDLAERSSVLSGLSIQLNLYAQRRTADDALPTDRLAAETVFTARNGGNPSLRVMALGNVAIKLAQRGNPAQASVLLDEAQGALDGLDPQVHKWHFARIAAIRALIDPNPAGMQLSEIPKDETFWRLFAQMQIARRRPREAESLLAAIDPAALFRDERAQRPQRQPLYCTSCDVLTQICIQAAAADPICAERIAARLFDSLKTAVAPGVGPGQTGPGAIAEPPELISDVEFQLLKGVTLARMAERVVATDRYQARRWLERAVEELAARRGSKFRDDWFHAPAAAMATLLPLAEQFDPELARELFWRALSLRVPRSAGEGRVHRAQDSNTAKLARMIGRYDLDVARQLLAPLLENNRAEFLAWSPVASARIHIDGEALLATARDLAATRFDESPSSRERLRPDVASRLSSVQNEIDRDLQNYLYFELELMRESLGFNFCHPRLDE